MRQIKTRLITLFSLAVIIPGLRAQNTLNIIDKSSSVVPYKLNDVRKLTFPSGNVLVYKSDGTSKTYSLSNIQHIDFSNTWSEVLQPDKNETANLSLFPNPVIDELRINYQSSENSNLQIDIFNLQGKLLYHKMKSSTIGINQISINVSQLSQGLFVCRLQIGSKIESVKFLKNK